jgi:cytochrome c oxidase subunit 1
MVAQDAHAHSAPQGFIRKYIFSLDHKVIGIQYYFLALAAVFVGMFLSLLMRIHLVWPGVNLPIMGEIKPETYLSLLTMHGTIMVFFVLTTAPQGGFGNYFLPIQIGAPDMAFPVLNMLSFWTTFIAFIVMIAAFLLPAAHSSRLDWLCSSECLAERRTRRSATGADSGDCQHCDFLSWRRLWAH